MELLYGTSNPAKLASMRKILSPLGVEVIGLRDLDAPIPAVDENGASPCENARLKAAAYFKAFNRPVFSCDSGLYIDGLADNEQPGVNVRTVGCKRLSDDEMIEHYAAIARNLGGKVTARYRNAVCFVKGDDEVYESFADDLSGEKFYIADKPHEKRREGFPLDSLSVHIESGKYYNDMPTNEFSEVWYDAFRRFFEKCLKNGLTDLSFSEMLDLQRVLQARYADKWGALSPEKGSEHLLWLFAELGEAAEIIKKDGNDSIMNDAAVRAHFVEEIGDALNYVNSVMLCYDITPAELAASYRAKHERNMTRWKND